MPSGGETYSSMSNRASTRQSARFVWRWKTIRHSRNICKRWWAVDTDSSLSSAAQMGLRRAQTSVRYLSRSLVRRLWLRPGCLLKNRRLHPKINESPRGSRTLERPVARRSQLLQAIALILLKRMSQRFWRCRSLRWLARPRSARRHLHLSRHEHGGKCEKRNGVYDGSSCLH